MRTTSHIIKNLKIKIDPELNCQMRIKAMKILREWRGYGIGEAKDELDGILSNYNSLTGEPVNGEQGLERHSYEWDMYPKMFDIVLEYNDPYGVSRSIEIEQVTDVIK